MRYPVLALIMVTSVSIFTSIGCKETSIGQPCQFNWPEDANGGAKPCTSLPQCHPLLQTPTGTVPADACPLDCIEMPTIQCNDLICVATQVPNDYQQMNGQCNLEDNPTDTQCPKKLSGCMGYCTRECNSDDDCPDGYTCRSPAPYSTTLPCAKDQEDQWPDNCTDDCVDTGYLITATTTMCNPADENCCPSASEKNKCRQENGQYDTCCYCICSKFCPVINTKICRKEVYDEAMFPKGKLSDEAFTTLNECYQRTGQ
jgi:hypothetical protein